MTLMIRPLALLRHRRLRKDLDAFVDGELSDERHNAMAAHLDDCPGCSKMTRQLRRIKASLRAQRASITPADADRMHAYAEQLTST